MLPATKATRSASEATMKDYEGVYSLFSMVSQFVQKMAAGFEGVPRVWSSVQSILVSAVPSLVRCPGPNILISPDGGRPVPLLQ